MTDKPVYRWDVRRAAKERREKNTGAISTHDLVMLTIIMAMLVIVLRFIFIFGGIAGMEIGPFSAHPELLTDVDRPYADIEAVTESFHELKYISAILAIYWALASWNSFKTKSVDLSTKLFKSSIGVSILVLLVASFLPEHAIFLAENWFQPSYRPVMKG
ncbi:MAG: hypothetical protein ABJN22_13360 [Litorimonas sp.]